MSIRAHRRSSPSVLALAVAVCYSLRHIYWVPGAGSANICPSSDGRLFLWRFARGALGICFGLEPTEEKVGGWLDID